MFRYRTYRRPRYKVAYKMVTEMEWRCCHGYSGEDCHDGPKAPTTTQVNGGRPHGTTNNGGGQGSQGGKKIQKRPCVRTQTSLSLLDFPLFRSGDTDRIRKLEETIRELTKEFNNVQTTMQGINQRL